MVSLKRWSLRTLLKSLTVQLGSAGAEPLIIWAASQSLNHRATPDTMGKSQMPKGRSFFCLCSRETAPTHDWTRQWTHSVKTSWTATRNYLKVLLWLQAGLQLDVQPSSIGRKSSPRSSSLTKRQQSKGCCTKATTDGYTKRISGDQPKDQTYWALCCEVQELSVLDCLIDFPVKWYLWCPFQLIWFLGFDQEKWVSDHTHGE